MYWYGESNIHIWRKKLQDLGVGWRGSQTGDLKFLWGEKLYHKLLCSLTGFNKFVVSHIFKGNLLLNHLRN